MRLKDRNRVANMIHMSVGDKNVIHVQGIDVVFLGHLEITPKSRSIPEDCSRRDRSEDEPRWS